MIVETFSIGEFSKLGLLNSEENPRLRLAREYFIHGNIDLEVLTDLYRYWRDLNEYGVIEKSWFELASSKPVQRIICMFAALDTST